MFTPHPHHGSQDADNPLTPLFHAPSPYNGPYTNISEDKPMTTPSWSGSSTVHLPHHSPHMRAHKRCHRDVTDLPFLQLPLDSSHSEWYKEETRASEWLSLFFDLVVVAVLNVFGGTHELVNPGAIPNFLAYYTVIVFMWTSQTHFDVRYESNDFLNRLLKCGHIILFVYIGAAGGGWDLGAFVTDPKGQLDPFDQVQQSLSHASFLTITLVLVVHRILLSAQYIIVACLGRKVGRSDTKNAFFSAAVLVVSALIAILAAALPARTSTGLLVVKVMFLYLSIVVELVGSLVQVLLGLQTPAPGESIAEHYGGLTLIVVGEGFINLSRAFQAALAGASSRDKTLYAHVFLVICILFYLWIFLFADLRKDDHVESKRGWMWEAIHFPLLFCVLLFLAGMVNVVVVSSFGNGLGDVLVQVVETLYPTKTASGHIAPSRNLTASQLAQTANYVNRLNILPDFATEVQEVTKRFDIVNRWIDANSTSVLNLEMQRFQNETLLIVLQYFATVTQGAALSAKVEIPHGAQNAYQKLMALPDTVNITTYANGTTYMDEPEDEVEAHHRRASLASHASSLEETPHQGNSTGVEELVTTVQQVGPETVPEAIELCGEVFSEIINDAYTGILWVFPASGATLFLCALRSMLRYRFNGVAHWIVHGFQMAAGVLLSLLAILDAGSHTYVSKEGAEHLVTLDKFEYGHFTPIYKLADNVGVIPIIFGVYTAVAMGTTITLRFVHRRRGGVFKK